MSDREEVLRGTIRQMEREAAATELYLKKQIERLKERLVDELVDGAVLQDALQDAFEGGWVARDSGAAFSELDEWYETWVEDEKRRL